MNQHELDDDWTLLWASVDEEDSIPLVGKKDFSAPVGATLGDFCGFSAGLNGGCDTGEGVRFHLNDIHRTPLVYWENEYGT